LVVRLNDQLSKPIAGLQDTIKKFVVGLGLAKLFKDIVKSTAEAESAIAQLNIAFRNSAESARRSKDDILAFSDAVLKSSTFGDEAATRAQTTLLRFSRVNGQIFSQARKDILDVAAALDTDLESAAQLVGRALQAPEQGMRQLRQAGIIFSESQRKVIQNLVETGNTAEAQRIILQRLEDTFGGASDAARNTLGGALKALKNNFGELFESTEKGASSAARGVNELTKVISDPEFKSGIQSFTEELLQWAAAFVNLTGKAVSGWQQITGLAAKGIDSLVPSTDFESAVNKRIDLVDKVQRAEGRVKELQTQGFSKKFAESETDLPKLKKDLEDVEHLIKSIQQAPGTGRIGENWIRGGSIGGHQATPPGRVKFVSPEEIEQQQEDAKNAKDAMDKALASLEPVRVSESLLADPIIAWEKDTRTAAESVAREYEELQVKLEQLVKAGVITSDEAAKRENEKLNDILQPIQISVERMKVPLTAAQEKAKEFTDTLKTGLENAARAGETTGRSILRNLLAAFESKALQNAIDELGDYIQRSLTKASTSGGNSFVSSLAGIFGGLFGGSSGADSLQPVTTTVAKIPVHAAGGGSMSGARIVGEDGPELLLGSGQVMNRRQLQFAMGGGGNVSYTPNTVINVEGSGDPQQTAALVEARIQQNNRRQLEQINRLMKNNGFGDLR
jgi:predicted transcriptional regulator